MHGVAPGSLESRQDLLLEELEEAVLIGTYLVHVDVVESAVEKLLDRAAVLLGVGSADNRFGHIFLAHGRDRLLAHGYSLGEGYVDLLSQYQSLEDAAREGRIRDLEGLLTALNSTHQK